MSSDIVSEPQPPVMPSITCACGFTVSGFDEAQNAQAHDNHFCPGDVVIQPLHVSMFSFFGTVIILGSLLIIAIVIEEIMGLAS